jgi:hypothetical protein
MGTVDGTRHEGELIMYIETKDLPVTAPARVGRYHELAELLRHSKVVPDPLTYGQGKRGCALCAIARGMGMRAGRSLFGHQDYLSKGVGKSRRVLNERFGRPIIDEIELRFSSGEYTFAELADWLDSQSL